nr:MAG TPA: hypothetical protein [Caudoviricetes sp.]
MENKDWSPLEEKSFLISNNGWIFVEVVDDASVSEETNLKYGRIISAENHDDWIDNICEQNEVILFKATMNYFEFQSISDDFPIQCYAIKAEDIMGHFDLVSKYFSTKEDKNKEKDKDADEEKDEDELFKPKGQMMQ